MTFSRIRTCNLLSESQLITTRPQQLYKYIYKQYIYIYNIVQRALQRDIENISRNKDIIHVIVKKLGVLA